MAMGTFKIIGRLRMARSIGKDIAAFYMYVCVTLNTDFLFLTHSRVLLIYSCF